MLLRARVAKAGSDMWGQARPCVSAEVEALAAAREEAAMAELLAEAKPRGAAGSAGGSSGGAPARGRKGKGGSVKRR